MPTAGRCRVLVCPHSVCFVCRWWAGVCGKMRGWRLGNRWLQSFQGLRCPHHCITMWWFCDGCHDECMPRPKGRTLSKSPLECGVRIVLPDCLDTIPLQWDHHDVGGEGRIDKSYPAPAPNPRGSLVTCPTSPRRPKNHLEERSLDQALARTPYSPPFWGSFT